MKQVYLIGNAHIDPVWLWRRGEGMSEVLSTFRSALDRMKEFPNYIFTSACAAYYQWVEQVDPQMFEEIRERVREGRWAIVGGWWVQPDCNIPSGESFARHSLYSQRYFMDKFGVTAKTGYNVDSFGHNGMLPQLLRKAGMHRYVFMRPDDWEDTTDSPIPGELFLWQSPDGSRVTTGRIYLGYANHGWGFDPDGPHGHLEPSAAKAMALRERAAGKGHPYFGFYGVGNHGGGPTIRDLEALDRVTAEHPDIVYASPDDLFDAVEAGGLGERLSVLEADLQHHASGCYSAHSGIKSANRRAEHALMAAEKYGVMAQALTRADSQEELLRDAWKNVLFNQFHDILAGCSIRSAYADALDAFGAARDAASRVGELAAQRISWRICTTRILDGGSPFKNGIVLWEKQGEGAPLVVFNPHSFDVDTLIPANVSAAGVADQDGNPLPCQQVRGEQTNRIHDRYNTLFPARIPALGYSTFYIYKDQELPAPAAPLLKAGPDFMENEHLRVCFDQNGRIVSLYDKQGGRELAGGPVGEAVMIDDEHSDTWAHGVFAFDRELGRFEGVSVRLLEFGPLRACIQVNSAFDASSLTQEYMLCAGGSQLTVRCKLNLQHRHAVVKLCFPLKAERCGVSYSMPYGFIEKSMSGREEPSHEWTAVFDTEDRRGLVLINDCKYSFSAAGRELRMTVARSAMYADHFGLRDGRGAWLDLGEQDFTYALLHHDQNDPAPAVRAAALLNQAPYALPETHHGGALPNTLRGMDFREKNVLCQSLKPAEDGDGYIARFCETAGRPVHTAVRLPLLACEFGLELGPQEVKTLRIRQKENGCREVLLTEWEPS